MEPRHRRRLLPTPAELGPDPEPLGVRYDVLMARIEARSPDADHGDSARRPAIGVVPPAAPTEEISERVAAAVGA
jgi:hypothetical protein